jgi:flagellar biosynthetic protein FlhB
MAEDESGDKTEDPTERRRSEARERGNVVKSQDLTASALMLGSAGVLWFHGRTVAEYLARMMRSSLSADPWVTFDRNDFIAKSWAEMGEAGWQVAPILMLLAISAIAINVLQVGFLFSPQALEPKFERINPLAGLQRIFSITSVARLGASLSKLTLLGSVATYFVYDGLHRFAAMANQPLSMVAILAGSELVSLIFWMAIAIFVAATADFAFQWWKYEQDLKMSKQEVRDEYKEMDGDPLTRMRRREAHRKLTQGRELQAVKTADVVVTNPTEIAVAIKYDVQTMPAPIVVAKGAGELAAQIRRLATENGVPIIERKPVARALFKLVRVGDPIPSDLYAVFAEILAYVYKITGRKPPKGLK